MTTLRAATPDDAATLHHLIVDLAVYEREPDAVEATAASLKAQMELESPPFEALIAEDEDGPLGFALYFHNYSTWRGRRGLYLEDLFVTPAARGQGIGRQLLSALAAIAVERDCARMEWSVLDWNTDAIGFYETLGAKPQDDWTVFRLTGQPLQDLASTER